MPRVLPARLRGLPLLAAVCAVVSCPVAGCSAVGGGAPAPGPSPASAGPTIHLPSRARPSPTGVAPAGAVPVIAGWAARLASQLTAAETVLAEGDAPPALMARQALIVQLACLRVAAHPGWASVVTQRVAPARRAAAGADIAATADLVALTQPRPRLPPWRIVAAENPATLLADYRATQAATGVGWSYLAAINFVETDFGRVAGPSSAGAQGPMQFMPATWAVYGHGNIHRPRNAILAAGRFLAARGAAGSIGSALYAYNPSWRYVDAVLRYARRLRADPQALMGYYRRQVVYRLASGWVLLPAGYGIDPAVRAIPVHV
ncbi:MAG TPA: lytic transglycosylase domain-containing protein [Streptosporangiaceae bacterium]|nr:lytic transglycosylase domain-containing protein [Streptosporangiaceae bacterium]